MLDKWKLQDDGTVAAKSRSVLVGWKDPMIYQLERAAPTPTQKGGRTADLTSAFGQARETSRKNKLATKLPPGIQRWDHDSCCVVVEGKLHCGFVGCRLRQKSVRQMLVHTVLFR